MTTRTLHSPSVGNGFVLTLTGDPQRGHRSRCATESCDRWPGSARYVRDGLLALVARVFDQRRDRFPGRG